MGHISGPKSHVSIAFLIRLLLALELKIWDRECLPFWPNFAVFSIIGQVGNTISPWGKGPSYKGVAILLAFDEGSMALPCHVCCCGLAKIMQLMVRAALPNFAFLAVFCPVA